MRFPKITAPEIFARYPFWMAAFVTVGVFLLYAGTLVPEVGWGDSAELSLVAYQLGLTHPPGYPLHTMLGKVATMFFAEPAIGTNILSAICTGLAAGALSRILFDLTARAMISIAVPVVFAVLPNIWEMAVVTEVYNVNILFLALAIWCFLRAEQTRFSKYLLPSAVLFGLSLGTYQANLLLLPAFLLVLWIRSPERSASGKMVLFCSVVCALWLLFAGYSVIRSRAALAFTYPLNSFQEIAAYVSGANLSPPFPQNLAHYVNRTLEHGRLFSENFLYLPIPIGLLGAVVLFGHKRATALFLALLFLTNYLFFSYYAVSDYFTMPTPSYFIFSIFVGYGLAFLAQRGSAGGQAIEYAGVAACVLLVGAQLFLQFPARFERSNTIPVTNLILPALEAFPPDAIIISRWERYAPMLYFQQTRDLRKDVTLAISSDYLAQIHVYSNGMPGSQILIDNRDKELTEKYRLKHYYRRWYLIVAPAGE